MSVEQTGAHCARHPEVAAVAPCARCGTFLCSECSELVGEAVYCAGCVVWLRQHGPPSRGVQAVLALNIAAIVCFPMCGFSVPLLNVAAAASGLWWPPRERRRIQQGQGPLRGARQAQVAQGLAVVNLLLLGLWLTAVLYAWSRGAIY
ncbi:hypothetical protein [Stigmatella aurantiaca]|uniref:Conserved uncharacterized protein n=1 Tax=Stigmatella aurantiaca (strain DW4/3-1) TaxID=378806 RepID=E3FNH6_STIAD|nr:hypothetical protein [Stigmatella aurantiaca]ADO75649.1 conserved uncharacterized protein [Stigmatella aurantiaca DW4/3-1]